ncbi:hypothetical protein C5O79_35050 [Burkholderia sp. SRS-25]|nr:hypothetical protein C5O79_35050 [Burkholderia sp. SRS-25]
MPAVAGAGGIDATSLGFGRQTKHPARRQAPLPHVQHCAGELSVEYDSRLPAAGQLAAARAYRVGTHRACPPLYKRRAPPNLF